ncbi:MAG TPA: hypothetical protein VM779_02560 [Thermoanaerobaculia bacterium]|nr:hypothetical protein [Thermoanaerobaculia bacterium]
MAIACPGCRALLDVEQSHGWPYIRSAVMLHLEACTVLECGAEQRSRCAEAIADFVAPVSGVASDQPFRCPFAVCGKAK